MFWCKIHHRYKKFTTWSNLFWPFIVDSSNRGIYMHVYTTFSSPVIVLLVLRLPVVRW